MQILNEPTDHGWKLIVDSSLAQLLELHLVVFYSWWIVIAVEKLKCRNNQCSCKSDELVCSDLCQCDDCDNEEPSLRDVIMENDWSIAQTTSNLAWYWLRVSKELSNALLWLQNCTIHHHYISCISLELWLLNDSTHFVHFKLWIGNSDSGMIWSWVMNVIGHDAVK